MVALIRLVRPLNLFLLLLAQWLIKLVLIEPLDIETALNTLNFALLTIATISLAAGGYVINDILDVEIDRINKPKKQIIGRLISEKAAYNLYFVLTVLGVGLGFLISNNVGKPGFSALFIIIAALLYIYATYLKSLLLVGNLLISILVSLSILIVGVFEFIPVITEFNRAVFLSVFQTLVLYSAFAFYINSIREITKDIEDLNGDKNGGRNTLPIAIGRKRATNMIFALGVFGFFGTIYYTYFYLYQNEQAVLYFILLLAAPLLFFSIKSWSAKKTRDYKLLSNILKFILFTGVCSLILFKN